MKEALTDFKKTLQLELKDFSESLEEKDELTFDFYDLLNHLLVINEFNKVENIHVIRVNADLKSKIFVYSNIDENSLTWSIDQAIKDFGEYNNKLITSIDIIPVIDLKKNNDEDS